MADREIPSPRRDDPVIQKWGRGAISAKMKPHCLPILEMWLAGATLREVGAHHNVSAERVREIIWRIRHRSYKAKNLNWMSGDTLSLGTLVDHFLIETRASNCLKNEGIETLGDLVAKAPVDLLKIANFGKKSLREIQVILAEFGFSLAPNPPKIAKKRTRAAISPTIPLEPVGPTPDELRNIETVALHSLLLQWREADESGDDYELYLARMARDEMLKRLGY